MAEVRRCDAGHELSPWAGGRPCPTCRRELVATRVAEADPTLAPEAITAAVEATVTSPAVLRELAAALADGPEALHAGAPAVVGRLLGELRAHGSPLQLPRCATCGRSDRPLVRSGSVGVCARCRSHELAEACAGCGETRPVISRDADGSPRCWRCSDRPRRRCGRCGRERPIARRATADTPDICDSCFRPPVAVCGSCERERPCHHVAAGRPICAACSPRRSAACAHCGLERPPCARWPEGPVCEPCYRAALGRRGTCAGCGQERRLVSPPGPQARLCCDCAGVPPLARCQDCGIEDRLHQHGRCARCALAHRARALLAGPDGSIAEPLVPVFEAVVAARQPHNALNWLRQGAAAAILAELASGAVALSHEALDTHPHQRAADYLRHVLVANGALPARHEELARMERWVKATVRAIDQPEDRRLVHTFATWTVLRHLRRRVDRGEPVRTRHAKTRITAATRFLAWLRARDQTLAEVCQADIDIWLATEDPAAADVGDFLRWAAERKLAVHLEVPAPGRHEATATDDEHRWAIIQRLLHDDKLDLTDRVAGCLVLLYAQQLSRIVAITVDHIDVTPDGEVLLRIGNEEVPLPEPLGDLVLRLADTGRRYVGIGTPQTTRWLFPGHLPGRALSPARLGERLAKLGIKVRAGRRAALMHLAARLPAAVLADLLGIHATTAVRWVNAAGGDWSPYAAQLARERDRAGC